MWIRPVGPPRIIESDQEGGLLSEEEILFRSGVGTTLKEKGFAHAQMLELYHAILRQAYLGIKAQVEDYGLDFNAQQLLAMAVTAKSQKEPEVIELKCKTK
eukprot:6480003-Prorocentrum_lima.AAC.1